MNIPQQPASFGTPSPNALFGPSPCLWLAVVSSLFTLHCGSGQDAVEQVELSVRIVDRDCGLPCAPLLRDTATLMAGDAFAVGALSDDAASVFASVTTASMAVATLELVHSHGRVDWVRYWEESDGGVAFMGHRVSIDSDFAVDPLRPHVIFGEFVLEAIDEARATTRTVVGRLGKERSGSQELGHADGPAGRYNRGANARVAIVIVHRPSYPRSSNHAVADSGCEGDPKDDSTSGGCGGESTTRDSTSSASSCGGDPGPSSDSSCESEGGGGTSGGCQDGGSAGGSGGGCGGCEGDVASAMCIGTGRMGLGLRFVWPYVVVGTINRWWRRRLASRRAYEKRAT